MQAKKHQSFAFLLLIAAVFGSSASAADKPQQGVDFYGDPLPEGAMARMGTMQFHQPTAGSTKLFLSEVIIPAAFSPDGRVIATHWEKRLRLWSANTGRLLVEITAPDLIWGGAEFSPDSRYIAAALSHEIQDKRDTYVVIWDVKTGKLSHRFRAENGLKSYVRHVAFSPDGKLLAATDEPHEKGAIHVWNTETGKEVAVLASESSKITADACIAFSPDGKTLVAMPYQSNEIWHWDIAKGEIGKRVPLEGIYDAGDPPPLRNVGLPNMYDWHLSKDGKTLACRFCGDGMARLVDTATGKTLRRFQKLTASHSIVALTNGGRSLATAEYKDRPEYKINVSICDSKTGQLKHQFKIPRLSGNMVFSPDGSRMIFASSKVRLYDVASGNELLKKPVHEGVYSLAFTPDGGTLISGGVDSTIGIWDAPTGKRRHFIRGDRWGAMSVAEVPGDSTFVSGDMTGSLRLYDWRTGEELRRFGFEPKEKQQFRKLRVRGDGKTLIGEVYVGNENKPVPFHSWDLTTGKLLKSFPKQGNAEFIDLTDDGERFIGLKNLGGPPSNYGYTVDLREIDGGRLLFSMKEANSFTHTTGGILAPNGRLFIYHTYREKKLTIHLRELATGKERLNIVSKGSGQQRYYEKIALSPDGRIVAAAEHDGPLQLWDLLTGKELMRRSGYDDPVHSMTFSANGRFLATAHEDGTILVWDISLPQRKPSQAAPTAEALASWWQALAGEDAARAYAAIAKLVEAPQQAIDLFKGRLHSAADKSDRIAKLISQLDDDQFTAREAASNELKSYACQAVPSMQRALKQKISLEERLRIELILDRPALLVKSPDLLRAIRAVEVLEYIAAPGSDATRLAAIDLLKKLAAGAAEAPLTREAKAALRRLETRKP